MEKGILKQEQARPEFDRRVQVKDGGGLVLHPE